MGAAGAAGIGFGLVEPVDLLVVERAPEADRGVDQDVRPCLLEVARRAVVAAGLDQQHPGLGIGRQPVGEHAAGAARADDDVVECADVRHDGRSP